MCIEECGSLGLSRCSHELAAERERANVSAIGSVAQRGNETSSDDPGDGKWHRNGRRLVLASAMLTGSIGLVGASQAAAAPCEDTDGDGWGWDGSATCVLDASEGPDTPEIAAALNGGWTGEGDTDYGGSADDNDNDNDTDNDNDNDDNSSESDADDRADNDAYSGDDIGDGYEGIDEGSSSEVSESDDNGSQQVSYTEEFSSIGEDYFDDEFDDDVGDNDPSGIGAFGVTYEDNFGSNYASTDYNGGDEDKSVSDAPEAMCVDSAPVNDGWGWNGTASCELPIEAGRCRDTAPFGDGWGWNGVDSCRLMEVTTPEDDDYILRDPDSQGISGCWDTDGDGYGIDYDGASCVVPTATPIEFSDLLSSLDVAEELSGYSSDDIGWGAGPECVDSDGDGWGWDGDQSCEIYNAERLDLSQITTTDSYEERCRAEFGDVRNGSCVVCADPYIYDLFSPWEGPDGDTYVDNRAMECRDIEV